MTARRLNQNRLTLISTMLAIGFALQACGGGGGDSNDSGSGGSDTASDADTRSAWVTTEFTPEEGEGGDGGVGGGDGGDGIGAGGSLGKFSDASVEVFDASGDSVGKALVGANGFVAIRRPSDYNGPISAAVVGSATSSYFDEARLAKLSTGSGTILTARVPLIDKSFGITPLTHAAAAFDEQNNRAAGGAITSDSIKRSNEAMLAQINRFLPADKQLNDILLVPVLVDSEQALKALNDTPADRYAKAIASFAVAAQKFNPSLANPAQAFAAALANDMTDGVIDDKDVNGLPIAPAANLPYRSPELKTALATAIDEIERQQDPTSPTAPVDPLFPSAEACKVTIVSDGQVYSSVGIRTEKVEQGYVAFCSYQTGQSAPVELVRIGFVVEEDDPEYISEFCGLQGDAVVSSATEDPPFYVAYSTRRQVAANFTLPNNREVPLAVMRRAVEEGVGRPCPALS